MNHYDVELGGIFLYGVTNFSESNKRKVEQYDGIGQGSFPVPENRDLKTWELSCELSVKQNDRHLPGWVSAKTIFKALDKLLESKEPARLIVAGDDTRLSVLALLEGYDKKELFDGVYEVSIQLVEYKEAGIRTSDVPFAPRPGKAPEADTFIIPSDKPDAAYDAMVRKSKSSGIPLNDLFKHFYVVDENLKKYTNPVLFPENKVLHFLEYSGVLTPSTRLQETRDILNRAARGKDWSDVVRETMNKKWEEATKAVEEDAKRRAAQAKLFKESGGNTKKED